MDTKDKFKYDMTAIALRRQQLTKDIAKLKYELADADRQETILMADLQVIMMEEMVEALFDHATKQQKH